MDYEPVLNKYLPLEVEVSENLKNGRLRGGGDIYLPNSHNKNINNELTDSINHEILYILTYRV